MSPTMTRHPSEPALSPEPVSSPKPETSPQLGRPEPAPSSPSRRPVPWRVAVVVVRTLTSLALAAAVGIFLFLAVGPHLFGYRTVTMLSGSMAPGIRPGDVVVDTPEPLSAVRVGQAITFHTPTPNQYVDSHRVVEVRHLADGTVMVRTKGDANTSPDPWLAVLHGSTAWRVRAVVPHLGTAIHLLRNPRLHTLLAWVAPGLLVATLLVGIWSPASKSSATTVR